MPLRDFPNLEGHLNLQVPPDWRGESLRGPMGASLKLSLGHPLVNGGDT